MLNWLDYLLIVVMGVGFITGFLSGFMKQFFGLLSWILAIAAAVYLGDSVNNLLRPLLPEPAWMYPAAGSVLAFIVIFVSVSLAGKFLADGDGPLASGVMNKVGGGLLGMLKSGAILVILCWLPQVINWPSRDQIDQSVLFGPFYHYVTSFLNPGAFFIRIT